MNKIFDTIAIIGTGLIGGSMAIALKDKGLVNKIIGVDASHHNLHVALQSRIVDEIATLDEAIASADAFYVAIPVNYMVDVVKELLDKINAHQVVMDAGSTKAAVCEAISAHPNRGRFVATHPMWGTEYSGPQAAIKNAFTGRTCVICEQEKSHADALEKVKHIYSSLGMPLVYMDAINHDVHAAYVSHISHITSFALANTVLEKEKAEQTIFELAGGGFESTVRLAKSNAAMWVPIFMQNKDNVLDVLNEHIFQLKKFKESLEKENENYLAELIANANTIKRILG